MAFDYGLFAKVWAYLIVVMFLALSAPLNAIPANPQAFDAENDESVVRASLSEDVPDFNSTFPAMGFGGASRLKPEGGTGNFGFKVPPQGGWPIFFGGGSTAVSGSNGTLYGVNGTADSTGNHQGNISG